MKYFCVVSHTHWDREWYMPLEWFKLKLVDLIDHLLATLEKYPAYIFHLDAQTVVLEDYLDSFNGAVIAVSHDRYFLDRFAGKIFAFMGNGEIRQFIGDYSKYEAAAAESKAMLAGGAKTGTGKERIEAVKSQSKQIKMTYKEKLEFEQIETMIAGVEAELKMLTLEVNSAGSDFVKLGELTAQQQDAEQRLEQLVERWAYLTELAEASGVF